MYSDSSLVNAKYLGKRVAKWALKRDHLIRPDVSVKKVRLGSRYGGWFVYDAPLKSKAKNIVLSFGIGNDISFDNAMIEDYNAQVYAFDPTPMSLDWLKTQKVHSQFQAFPLGLAAYDGIAEFGLPPQEGWDSYSMLDLKAGSVKCEVRRVETVMKDLNIGDINLMKMDIEGSEFEVIQDLLKSKIYPDQLLIEFHYHHTGPKTSDDVADAIRMLRDQGYVIYDVSPWGREFSMVKKKLLG